MTREEIEWLYAALEDDPGAEHGPPVLERDAGLEGGVCHARADVVAARGGGEGIQVHPAVPVLVAEGREVGDLLLAGSRRSGGGR
ncbi:hypothetical protein MIU24_05220 [Streptomyces venezuelae]|uniref:hypothetical protein n=1 Tax=Streptomyces sp. B6(2022) TaxID=3404749 RepID=UPI00311FFB08